MVPIEVITQQKKNRLPNCRMPAYHFDIDIIEYFKSAIDFIHSHERLQVEKVELQLSTAFQVVVTRCPQCPIETGVNFLVKHNKYL